MYKTMTNLVKKSVDVEKVLASPHQSCWERLMTWGLSKSAIVAIFVAITGWFGKALAQSAIDPWTVAGVKVTSPLQNARKIIFLSGFALILICALLALFKKILCFFVWCTLSWLGFVMATLTIIDSLVDRFVPINLVFIMVGIILFFLPLLISLIQYKRKKIEKKLLKRRVFTWFLPIIVFFFAVIFRFIFI